MTLFGSSKIYQHPKAQTLYVTIPSKVAQDSAFPFEKGEIVSIEVRVNEVIIKKRVS